MNKETGGPAFPSADFEHHEHMGMTLRDYFAAKAMQGLVHHFDFGTFRDDPMRLALWSYDAADAMMKAREQ
jgi:hypothetical protein